MLILPLAACGGYDTESTSPAVRAFRAQIRQSSLAAVAYRKEVTDYTQQPPQVEDTLYQPAWTLTAEGDTTFWPLEDLAYALDRYYGDPFQIDRFAVAAAGDTLIATVRPGQANKSDLQRQVILRAGPDGPYRYIESDILRDSWLYATEVHIAVHFDDEGRYQRHELEVQASVPLLGNTFHARLSGQMQYP
ncbi:MAG: hypothetical protein D6722_25855 [Bacteroidetes bacterium]|nr:MAG: hypothetical protein D6722_25855 [Bacteroidota bacterium]